MNKYRSISNPTLVIDTPLRSVINQVRRSNDRLRSITKILQPQTDRIERFKLDQLHHEYPRYQSQPRRQHIPSGYQHHMQQQYVFQYPQHQQQMMHQQNIPQYHQIPYHPFQQQQLPPPANRVSQFSNVFQMMMIMKDINKTPRQKKIHRKPTSPEQSSSESSIMRPIQSKKRIMMVRPKRKQLTPVIQQPVLQQVRQENNPQPQQLRKNDRLKLLKSQRGKLNLIKLKNAFWYVFRFRKYMYSFIEERKQHTRGIMPELIQSFMTTTEQWMRRVTKNIVEQIANIPNIDIIDKKITKQQMDKRILSLREIIKNILAALVNDCDMPQATMKFLSIFVHNYSHMPDNYLLKYELDRLEYSYHGALKNISKEQQHMLFVTNILIRILIFRVLARIGHEQKMKIICSILYDIFMLYIKSNTINGNMKHIPIQFKIKERQPSYYLLDQFEIHNEAIERLKTNQPLLHPLFENLMDNLQVQMVQQFCQNVENRVYDYYQMKHTEEIKIQRSVNKLPLKTSILQLIQARKQNYRAMSAEILSLS